MRIICHTDKHDGSGHYWPAREIIFERRFASRPIVALFIIFIGKAKTSLHIHMDIDKVADLILLLKPQHPSIPIKNEK